MTVYFVRHGESEQNQWERERGVEYWQSGRGSLTATGKAQAQKTGEYLSSRGIESIISSSYNRAKQTAEIIADATGVPVVLSDLFIEQRNPSVIFDTWDTDPGVREVVQALASHYSDPTWRHSDEETFFDLKERGERALAYLADLPYERVVVVTHSTFLRMLFIIMKGTPFTPAEFVKTWSQPSIKNGSVAEATFSPLSGWQVV